MRSPFRVACALLATLFVISVYFLPLGHAATFTVNDTGDTPDASAGDGTCADANGKCTLRAAVEEANALPGDDTITFSVKGTIRLGSGVLTIAHDLTIRGPGVTSLTVDTVHAGRVFNVGAGVRAAISGLTTAEGSFDGTPRRDAVRNTGAPDRTNGTLSGKTAAAAAPLVAAAPAISATKQYQLLVDNNQDGFVEDGDTVRYTVKVSNGGDADAIGVVFSDTIDPNTTLVPGSVESTPLAYNQTVSTTMDTPVSITLGAVDSDGDSITLSVIDQPDHGGLSGSSPTLTYTPDSGYVGPDSFMFQVCDPSGSNTCDSATVSINVSSSAAPASFRPSASRSKARAMTASSGTLRGGKPRSVPAGENIQLTIGTLPAGKSVTIFFDVTVANPLPDGVTQLVNQA